MIAKIAKIAGIAEIENQISVHKKESEKSATCITKRPLLFFNLTILAILGLGETD